MLSRVLTGKMLGQPLDARLIKWKLGLLWKNEVTLGLNGMFIKVLLEVDLQFPFKRVFIVNHDDDYPILVSYEKKIFKVCFYCGRMRLEGHACPEIKADDKCFMIDKVFLRRTVCFLGGRGGG